MRKTLLAVCLALGALSLSAENHLYEGSELGQVTGVSENGKYAVISDDANNCAFFWDAETPDVFTEISLTEENCGESINLAKVKGVWARGISNDGVIVGCVFYNDASGTQLSTIYKDGKWELLPLHEKSLGLDSAVGITGDGKVIGGMQFIQDDENNIHGCFWPVQWFLQDDGSYELKAYTHMPIANNHQGFWVVSQSPVKGAYLCGWMYCGKDSMIPAIVNNGNLLIFDEIVNKPEPFVYKGKYYCGQDENDKHIWTEDPNDPRIELFDSWYINGFKDMSDGSSLSGGFQGVDQAGNFYGCRTLVSNVQEDGSATLTTKACIYNINKNEWTYGATNAIYAGGFDGQVIFGEGNTFIQNGESKSISDLGVSPTRSIVAITRYDLQGTVLGGIQMEYNEATGEPVYYPFIITLDSPLFDTSGVEVIRDSSEDAMIILSSGRIDVLNATEITIYDLDGKLVSTSATSNVEAGIYVVKAGKTVKKVAVK